MLFKKVSMKELITVASSLLLLAEKLSSMDFENYFMFSKTSGSGNPVTG